MRKIISAQIFALSILVAGCGTARHEHEAIESNCVAEAQGPEAAVLSGKTFIGDVTEINAAMLSNPNLPTPAEAAALSALDARRAVCRQKIIAWNQQYKPKLVPRLQAQFYEEELAVGDLIARKTSYGDANRRIYEAYLSEVGGRRARRQAKARMNAAGAQ
ncbi:MAG TPA: hypothetical protein VG387_03285 [Rhizomicrobium sp.]|jgi:hypothetical protein|nr:hypothetical protein [Rhizomicrobium sp.]